MKKLRNIISLICIAALLASIFVLPAQAKPTPRITGTDVSDVIIKERDNPIVIEKERLTFDLSTLPYAKYRDIETFLAYDGKVTAEYTFYNPTDEPITATLIFRLGYVPSYGVSFMSEAELMDKYEVYVDGQSVEPKIRHATYGSSYGKEFELYVDSLNDEFIQDDFYAPDLTVTKYSYDVVWDYDRFVYLNVNVDSVGSERKIFLHGTDFSGDITDSGGCSMIANSSGENEKEIVSFYVLGKPLDLEPDAEWIKHPGADIDAQINGEFCYLGSESTTLSELIFSEYDKESGVSEVDWYNSCITQMKLSEELKGDVCLINDAHLFDASVKWYEYKIDLAPGERCTSTVVSPMYPQIHKMQKPYRYDYSYYLSPQRNWDKCSNLEIVINTPYEMSKVSIEGFENAENGYKLSRDGIPQNEEGYTLLYFSLLNDGNTPLEQPTRGLFELIATFFSGIFQKVIQFVKSVFN